MGRPSLPPRKAAKSDRKPSQPTSAPALLSREFTEEETLEFRDAFAMFDRDGSGGFTTCGMNIVCRVCFLEKS